MMPILYSGISSQHLSADEAPDSGLRLRTLLNSRHGESKKTLRLRRKNVRDSFPKRSACVMREIPVNVSVKRFPLFFWLRF